MSASPEENHELAKVLSRINILMGEGDTQTPALDVEGIPQLTEVYEGEPLSFAARSADEFPFLNEAARNPEIVQESAHQAEVPRAEVVEALLAEMMPVIQAIIKKAVLQEMEKAERPLCAELELEIMQSLRENLQSRLS